MKTDITIPKLLLWFLIGYLVLGIMVDYVNRQQYISGDLLREYILHIEFILESGEDRYDNMSDDFESRMLRKEAALSLSDSLDSETKTNILPILLDFSNRNPDNDLAKYIIEEFEKGNHHE